MSGGAFVEAAGCNSDEIVQHDVIMQADSLATDADEARRRIELLSDRLFANPVIEDWSLELLDS